MSRSSTFSSSLLYRHFFDLCRGAFSFVLWAVLSVSAVYAVDQWYRSVPLTEYDRRMIDFRNQQDHVEVLVLGSSQMFFGVDPKVLGHHTFNLAGPSQDVYYDSRIIERFADDMPKLRIVFWGVAPFSFGYDLDNLPGEKRREALYDRYFERRGQRCNWRCRLERWFEMLRVRGDDPIQAFLTLYRARGDKELRAYTPHADGFVPHKLVKERDDGARRALFHEHFYRRDLQAENYHYVLDATRRLESHGVHVVFVRPPMAKSYVDGFSPDLRHRFATIMDRLQAETGAEYVDMSNSVPFGHGYFRNSDHVQGQGVRLFSKQLASLAAKN